MPTLALFPGLCVVPRPTALGRWDPSLHRLGCGHRGTGCGCSPLAPQIESTVATEPDPWASVPESGQVPLITSRRLGEEQTQPEGALCAWLLKGGWTDPTWSGAGAESGLWRVYFPRGLKSSLSEARWKEGGSRREAGAGKTCESAPGGITVSTPGAAPPSRAHPGRREGPR